MKKILGLFVILLCIAGCEEVDVPFLVDSDEIIRYIEDDDLGKTFFSTANLVTELPYTYEFDTTGYYVDLFDSLDREIVLYFPLKEFGAGYADPTQEFGSPFGSSEDAEATVRDRVYARTIRVEGVDTTVVRPLVFRDYNRFGYFMKLGDDAQKFSGWLLRGFNGGSADFSTRMEMYRANNEWFSGDTFSYQHRKSVIVDNSGSALDTIRNVSTIHGYLMLNGDGAIDKLIERVPKDEILRAKITSTTYGVLFTTSYVNNGMSVLFDFGRNSEQLHETNIHTPSVNTNTWDFIYFQEFVKDMNDTTDAPRFPSLKRRNWVIPIKIE